MEQKIDGVLKISDRVAFLENGNPEIKQPPKHWLKTMNRFTGTSGSSHGNDGRSKKVFFSNAVF
ncbi:MAG: hypothetical protein Ct9H90mP9_5050 [Pseudomonadota bacterium]|nr:MAG: hypothetical protein Ct9H90mP9_5050 [Pseudomonadota bacterium]